MSTILCSFLRAALVGALLTAALPGVATAADDPAPTLGGHGFTLYGGWRFGGQFDEANTGTTVELRDDASVGLTLDFELDGQRELQLAYARQSTELEPPTSATLTGRLPLRLESLHVGGTYYGEDLGRGWYAIGGLGITRLTPSLRGYDSETKPSAHVGFGYLLPLGRNVGLRAEARVHAVLLDSSGALFCSGGCVVALEGDALVQGDLLLGVSARFR
jgi:hypothetical protein